jgi:hypothetical protein
MIVSAWANYTSITIWYYDADMKVSLLWCNINGVWNTFQSAHYKTLTQVRSDIKKGTAEVIIHDDEVK